MTRQGQREAIFTERGPTVPFRIWAYSLLPVVMIAIPVPFLGSEYWSRIGGFAAGYIILLVGSVFLATRRHWWVTPGQLCLNRLPWPLRVFYGITGDRCVPAGNIQRVEIAQGKRRELVKQAFGDLKGPGQLQRTLGSSHKIWCKTAIIVRLSSPDEYGDSVLLSTDRPQEAARVLNQAIHDARQRWGSTT